MSTASRRSKSRLTDASDPGLELTDSQGGKRCLHRDEAVKEEGVYV
jgi:hypothetical protein